ncbi:hypothetical protein [Streptomyces prunicolor]|uniref:hypothetical protein n=1 Tax=Streptomyces prunicolor TaxID=67348 RepID=UPI001319C284|nr:hypothetical protein [Streptomyces prunicolor]
MPDEVLQQTPLALLGKRGPAVLPVYELRMPKSLVGGLVDQRPDVVLALGPPSQAAYTRLVHSPCSGTLGSWRCDGSSWVPCGRPKSITGGSKEAR